MSCDSCDSCLANALSLDQDDRSGCGSARAAHWGSAGVVVLPCCAVLAVASGSGCVVLDGRGRVGHGRGGSGGEGGGGFDR